MLNPVNAAAQLGQLALRQVSSTILRATDGRDVLLNTPDGWEVEQPWLWWTGPAGGNGSGGPWGHPIPGANNGAWASFASIPAVARSTELITDVLASLPWHVMRGQEQLPTPDWITDPQALRLDGRVVGSSGLDAAWSWMDFYTQWLTSALWFGDGYIYTPLRDASGAPKPPMWVLHPHDVDIRDGAYWVQDVRLDRLQIIHLRGKGPVVEGHGTGAFDRFASQLGYTQSIRDYAAGVFYSGVPAGYLKVTKDGLSQERADDLKSHWMQAHGSNTKSIAVLNATTEFHPLTFTPVDAELLGAMAANLTEVANAFGVPPYMIGAPTDSNTYANVESRRMDLVTFTYLPWSARIEACLDAQLPRGTSLKLGLDALLRADTKTRYEAYGMALKDRWLTVDEVRELEDRPPLEEQPAIPQQLPAIPEQVTP
jgi:HK97 family phage portal protein